MKNSLLKNAFVGFGSQLLLLLIGFLVPRIIITHYGSDTNGLTNTITQVFTYMALLEAGIGQATQNALYPFISKNDHEEMSVVMSASRRYYRRVSFLYALLVVLMAISLPFILKTKVGFWTIFFYTFFEGLTSLITFYYTACWNYFLAANGKTYITNSINLFTKILMYLVKIFLALAGWNIALIQVGYFITSLIQLCIYYKYMKSHYSWIDYSAAPKDYKLKDRNAYVLTEIASAIFSSTDMIVLSAFVSTALSSVYSTYNMVYIALQTLLDSIYTSVKYKLGYSYQEGINKYKIVHDLYNSIFLGSTTFLVCVAYWLIIPFIKLYTKGVTDINYVYIWAPLCFSLVQMFSKCRSIGGTLTGIAGYAKPVGKVSMIEAFLNIVFSLIFVHSFGIYGVLIATVCALPVKIFYVNYVSDIKVIKRSPLKTVSIFGVNFFIHKI